MKNPIVTIEMSDNKKIVIELCPKVAPNTVNNFIHLIKTNFFDNMGFCRVVNNRLIQSGDPTLSGPNRTCATPGYILMGEFNKDDYTNPLSFERGVVGMAMADYEYTPDASAGSFFIMVKDEPTLDSIVPAFGKVIHGMDIVDEICSMHTHEDFGYTAPETIPLFKRLVVDTFGNEYPNPIKKTDTYI